jgi:hypothetical protein
MSKKTVELSAGPVAVKGRAVPPNDMAGKPTETEQDPLNFRLSTAFSRELKTYAAAHNLKLNELLIKSFESYRRRQAD